MEKQRNASAHVFKGALVIAAIAALLFYFFSNSNWEWLQHLPGANIPAPTLVAMSEYLPQASHL